MLSFAFGNPRLPRYWPPSSDCPMSQWKNPPPVVILSGNDEALRIRELKEAITAAEQTGRKVQYIRGEEHEQLENLFSSTGVFFKDRLLVIVENPSEAPVDAVVRHYEEDDNDVVLLLHMDGPVKAKSNLGKIAKKIPDRLVARFDLPKPWDAEDKGINFCIREAARYKLKLPAALAAAMVRNIGGNSGMLAFEVQKLALYVQARGITEVKPEHLSATMAAFSELGPRPVLEALERRDLKAVSRALTNMRRTYAGQLASAAAQASGFLAPSVRMWLHVAALAGEGLGPDEISEHLSLNSFRVRKNLLPVARRWGEGRLVTLLKSLAAVDRAVRSGHVNPWVEFECALFRTFDHDRLAVGSSAR